MGPCVAKMKQISNAGAEAAANYAQKFLKSLCDTLVPQGINGIGEMALPDTSVTLYGQNVELSELKGRIQEVNSSNVQSSYTQAEPGRNDVLIGISNLMLTGDGNVKISLGGGGGFMGGLGNLASLSGNLTINCPITTISIKMGQDGASFTDVAIKEFNFQRGEVSIEIRMDNAPDWLNEQLTKYVQDELIPKLEEGINKTFKEKSTESIANELKTYSSSPFAV